MPPRYKIYEIHNEILSSNGIFDITSIPAYDTMEILLSVRSTLAASLDYLAIQMNAQASADHYNDWQGVYNGVTSIYGQNILYTSNLRIAGNTLATGRFSFIKLYMTSYSDTQTKKQLNYMGIRPETITEQDVVIGSEVLQINTNPLTQIKFFPNNYPTDTFLSGSWIHIMGYAL